MATLEEPLDTADFDAIESALARTQKIESAIAKATRAGIDIGDSLALNRKNKERLISIKTAYFPGR